MVLLFYPQLFLYVFPKNSSGLSKNSFLSHSSLLRSFNFIWSIWCSCLDFFYERWLRFRWPMMSNDCVLECASIQRTVFFPFRSYRREKITVFFSFLHKNCKWHHDRKWFAFLFSVVSFRWSLHHEIIL